MKKKWKKRNRSPADLENKRREREQKLKEADARLSAGIEGLIRSGKWAEYLKFCSKFHRYSFFNTMLILLQRPDATQCASFNDWKKLGRHVREGEHGMDIFVPLFAKARQARPSDEAGSEPVGSEAEPDEKVLVGFKVGKTFDVSQTEGRPLPEPPVSLLAGDDGGLIQALTAYAASQGLEVAEFPSLGGANGVCVHGLDGKAVKIGLLESLPPAQKAKTLAHELGHAALHSELEYRFHANTSIQELEAESAAFMVMHHFGIDSGAYSFGYLAGWAGGEQAITLIKEHGERIYKAAFDIITWIEETFSPPSRGIPVQIPTTEDADHTGTMPA